MVIPGATVSVRGRVASAEPGDVVRRKEVEPVAIRLCDHALPFLFHTDPGTGRGALLYRRYDGEIGLLSVAADPTVGRE